MDSQDSKPFQWHFSDFNHVNFHIQGQSLVLLAILFSILLLFSLLFFYIHRIYHRSQIPTTAAVAIISSAVSHATATVARPLGLDATSINSLPIVLHSSLIKTSVANAVVEVTECSICLSIFEDEELVKVLPVCHHSYHSHCVDKWLSTQSSCPLCRASLRIDISDESIIH